jgi:hypothetical protein
MPSSDVRGHFLVAVIPVTEIVLSSFYALIKFIPNIVPLPYHTFRRL